MTLIEAGALLGLSPATLRQQIAKGVLKATKVGRDWSVTAREVERYRADHLGKRKKAQERTAADTLQKAVTG